MTQHLINTLRKSIVGAFLFLLPVKPPKFTEPEPVRKPLRSETDLLLFDTPETVSASADSYFGSMDILSDTLGKLQYMLEATEMARPNVQTARIETRPITTIWSDALLFDGEPYVLEPVHVEADMRDDVLFDPSDCQTVYGQIIAADQVSVQSTYGTARQLAA